VRDRGRLTDRVHRADLVVPPHHADHRRPLRGGGQRGPLRLQARPAALIDRRQLELGALVVGQPLAGLHHGVVLGRRDQHPAHRGSAARRAQQMRFTAWLSPSPPPPVTTTSDGSAPSPAAIDARDSPTRRRAARPAECNDEALPVHAGAALSVATAPGSIGVVAA
jgi:hypothetical protein